MLYQCAHLDCHEWRQPPGHSFTCVTCCRPLVSTPDYPSYELSFQAPRNVHFNPPPHGNLDSSISTTSAYSGSATDTSPSSLHDQMGPPCSSSEHGSLVPLQSPCLTSSHKPDESWERGPSRPANSRHHEAGRLRTTPPAFAANMDSSTSSLKPAGLLTHPTFEHFDPSAAKSSKVKARSCISCYRRNRSCKIVEGQEFCEFCSGRFQYCKGPIKMAAGFTPHRWIPRVMRRTGAEHILLDIMIEDNPLFDVRIMPGAENYTSSPSAQTKWLERCQLDLRSLRDDMHHSNDRPGWERLLDAISPVPEHPEGGAGDPNANLLDSFQRLCRQFTAALALLGSPELCAFDVMTSKDSAGPYIMLETFRQLGVQASSTFSKIFDALNDYLNAPRKRPAIRHGMLTLGSGLGLCHHALSHFGKALMGRTDFPSGLASLYDVAPCLLEQLRFLGDIFNSEAFQISSQAVPPKICGLHIALHPVEGDGSHETRKGTFIEGFEKCFGSTLFGDTRSACMGDLPVGRNLATSQGFPLRENRDGQPATADGESQVRAGHPSTEDAASPVCASQPTALSELEILERQVRSEISQLQQEREDLQKRTKAQIADYDERITLLQLRLGPGLVRNVGGQNGELEGWVEQIFPLTTPILSDADDNALVKHEENWSLEGPVGINSSSDEYTTGSPCRLDHEYTPMEDIATPSSTPQSVGHARGYQTNDHDLPPLKKRKRVFGIWQTQQQVIRRSRDDDDAIMADAMDVLPASLTAEETPASVSSLRKRLLQALPTGLSFVAGKSRTRSKAAGRADFVPETPPTNVQSQRPLSWPRTQRWRKSLGISVKTLRDNFEKLA